MRGKSFNRYMSYKKAARKRRIVREVYPASSEGWEYYPNLHQYSKNKIHCSCPMCSTKTRNKNRSRAHGWEPSINYKVSDKRKIDSLFYEE